mmetsp:Transcript_31401/g.71839  ORF Transcript_31401/g.71839 Transcript_31401/m.71839 type:complete len:232 (+) Transcript_31401:1079-1774(+)
MRCPRGARGWAALLGCGDLCSNLAQGLAACARRGGSVDVEPLQRVRSRPFAVPSYTHAESGGHVPRRAAGGVARGPSGVGRPSEESSKGAVCIARHLAAAASAGDILRIPAAPAEHGRTARPANSPPSLHASKRHRSSGCDPPARTYDRLAGAARAGGCCLGRVGRPHPAHHTQAVCHPNHRSSHPHRGRPLSMGRQGGDSAYSIHAHIQRRCAPQTVRATAADNVCQGAF